MPSIFRLLLAGEGPSVNLTIAQKKHIVKFGVEPYYYYFSLKKGNFTNSQFTLNPSFEYNYRMKNFDIVAKRTVHKWFKYESPIDAHIWSRLTKNYTLGAQKKLVDFDFISFSLGAGLVYFHGGDLYVSGNNVLYEEVFNKFGGEVFGRFAITFAPDLTIEPSFSLHLNPDSKYNGYSFIILLGYGF